MPALDRLVSEHMNLRKRLAQQEVQDMVNRFEPDLVTVAPPCSPWSSWQNLNDPEVVAELRNADLCFWFFTARIWERQCAGYRLVLTEQPEKSKALLLPCMLNRRNVHRVLVDQCMFGLVDPVSKLPMRKRAALDVNDPVFAEALAKGARCTHEPGSHQQIEGSVQGQRRSTLAGVWTPEFSTHILRAAKTALQARSKLVVGHLALHAEADESWVTAVAEDEEAPPEAHLREQLGVAAEKAGRYAYITFEGDAASSPARVKSVVSKLHVNLGHPSLETMLRMLVLSGAEEPVKQCARGLRCAVCIAVVQTKSVPKVAFTRPIRFNQRLCADTFYFWDAAGTKFAATHFLDAYSTLHGGDVCKDVSSVFVAETLDQVWIGIFGPPDVFMCDEGTEYKAALERLTRVYGCEKRCCYSCWIAKKG